ncbi:hypothetical protein D3C75_661080 [compost metagenome]
MAPDFESFVRGLRPAEDYETPAEVTLEENLQKVTHGAFSPLLAELCAAAAEVEGLEQLIRRSAERLVREKGYFALHADERSVLMYDVQFWLYTRVYPEPTTEEYLKAYSGMIAFGGQGFSTGGYAPGFVEDWLKDRLQKGIIKKDHNKLHLAEGAAGSILEQLKAAGQA